MTPAPVRKSFPGLGTPCQKDFLISVTCTVMITAGAWPEINLYIITHNLT